MLTWELSNKIFLKSPQKGCPSLARMLATTVDFLKESGQVILIVTGPPTVDILVDNRLTRTSCSRCPCGLTAFQENLTVSAASTPKTGSPFLLEHSIIPPGPGCGHLLSQVFSCARTKGTSTLKLSSVPIRAGIGALKLFPVPIQRAPESASFFQCPFDGHQSSQAFSSAHSMGTADVRWIPVHINLENLFQKFSKHRTPEVCDAMSKMFVGGCWYFLEKCWKTGGKRTRCPRQPIRAMDGACRRPRHDENYSSLFVENSHPETLHQDMCIACSGSSWILLIFT